MQRFKALWNAQLTFKLKWKICMESQTCGKFAICYFEENYAGRFLLQSFWMENLDRRISWSIYLLNFHNNCIRRDYKKDDVNLLHKMVRIHWKTWHGTFAPVCCLCIWPCCVSALSCCLFILTAAPDLLWNSSQEWLGISRTFYISKYSKYLIAPPGYIACCVGHLGFWPK